MQVFERLGRTIDQRWRARNYDEHVFPELAAAVLAEDPPRLDAKDVLAWVLGADVLPHQFDPQSKFGQPPVTMYRAPRFCVDTLFWMEGATDIHQHGFSGAFHVLAGSSVHTRYGFTLEDRVSTELLLGKVEFAGFELLGRGDTRPIESGDRLIHALFHLDRPSVTVVVRTYREIDRGPQYSYHPPFLAEDPFFEDPLLGRKLEALEVLHAVDPAAFDRVVGDLFADSDLYSIWRIAQKHTGKAQDLARLRELLERARPRQGARIDAIVPSIEELARIHSLVLKRKVVTDPETRFFLALLINLPTRRAVLEAVAARYPERDPPVQVADWVGAVADAVLGRASQPGDEDHTFAILAEILRGREGEGILEGLKEEYDAGDVEALRETIGEVEAGLRGAPLLLPLFR